MICADQKMTLYNKKTHKYNTYYYVKSVNSKVSGWTWNINLRKYQGINKQILKSFKSVKTNLRMQVIVNQIRTISDSDSQGEYLEANNLGVGNGFNIDIDKNKDDYIYLYLYY